MINLPDVTLVCVENRFHGLAINAIKKTCEKLRFKEVLFFTNPSYKNSALDQIPNIKVLPIEISSIFEYSQFILKLLNPYITTSHTLIIQWDGFIVREFTWNDEFLKFDYIGAPLRQKNGQLINGNGGFSLRSKKLLNALQEDSIKVLELEDACICIENRIFLEQKFQIDFAPISIAQSFSYEFTEKPLTIFGFHGFHNFVHELYQEELSEFIVQMPNDLLLNEYFPIFLEQVNHLKNQTKLKNEIYNLIEINSVLLKSNSNQKPVSKLLIIQLIHLGLFKLAKELLSKRRAQVGVDLSFIKLSIKMYLKKIELFFSKKSS